MPENFSGDFFDSHCIICICVIVCVCIQLSNRAGCVLRHVDTTQPAATPGRCQDGRTSRRRAAEDGFSVAAQ